MWSMLHWRQWLLLMLVVTLQGLTQVGKVGSAIWQRIPDFATQTGGRMGRLRAICNLRRWLG